jgi:hypothetical protein
MRSPSIKTLCATFRLTPEQAGLIKRLAKATDNADKLREIIEAECPGTEAYVRSMYSDPYNSHMWRVTVALHAMDRILGTYGVEGLGPLPSNFQDGPPYEYLNMGDTYDTTLVYVRDTDTLRIACWGDIAERHPNWSEQ